MTDGIHPVISAYMSRRGLLRRALSKDGSLTLRVNGKYRLRIHPFRANAVVLETLLRRFPMQRRERDLLIDRALRLACLRLKDHPCYLTIDRHVDALWLQRVYVQSVVGIEFDRAVAEFIASAETWTEALQL